MSEHNLREIDAWIRRVAVLGPIIAFVFGWGAGVLSAAVLYRDHEKRIQGLERCQIEQAHLNMQREAAIAQIKERIKVR